MTEKSRLPAFLFPGQGAQFLGMSVDLINNIPEVKANFIKGSELCGRDLIRIVNEGPEEELCRTDVSQVVIFLHSMAVLEAIKLKSGAKPEGQAACGLSLGEYSALVFAGSIEFEPALELVAKRGQFMQEAAEAEKGTMLTILGLEFKEVERLVEKARESDVLVIANWNSPTQVVASGHEKAISRLEKLAKDNGAGRVLRLKVAGSFHSPLMAKAEEKLRPYLEVLTIRPPCVTFIPNILGRITDNPEVIRECLIKQVTRTVLWTPTVKTLSALGVKRAVEAGPGRVLAGLVKRTVRELVVTSVGTLSGAESLAAR